MDEVELLIAEVRLGLQSKEFLGSPLGKYISGRALKAKQEAFESLIVVDPNDTESIRELQFRARLPSILFTWLDEAINQASHAEASLQDMQE